MTSFSRPFGRLCMLGLAFCLCFNRPLRAAETAVSLPLGRTAYQSNEFIDVAVQRAGAEALAASDLVLTLTASDGTKSTMIWAVPGVAVDAKAANARATVHLRVNARLLRPGNYTLDVVCDGASAKAVPVEIYSHIRKSSFRVVDWGSRAAGEGLENLREEGTGFNMILGDFRLNKLANVEAAIRGGLDFMQVCTMSGAHQMDLRVECDWSDPYVLGGGAARGVVQAFISRTVPNALGVHFYDEPGLTWGGRTNSPFTVPSQERSYKSAFGVDPFPCEKIDPNNPEARAAWSQWQLWHASFMDAAWKHSGFGVSYVSSALLPITQSVYGFTAYADGYYFNVVRSLPLISGHGGYSDGVGGYYYPAYHMEYGRARDLNDPYWYLPSWYGMSPEQYRVEQYMSFVNGVQGMMKPPDHRADTPATSKEAPGIVEANKTQSRIGTIFNEMPVTRPPVAVLYSMSQILDAEQKDWVAKKSTGQVCYEGGGHTRGYSIMNYIASKMIHVPMLPVVEEDVLDGTMARNHKVLVIPGVNFLEPRVIKSLEGFIKAGGTVLLSDDCKVEVPGSKKVGVALDIEYYYAGSRQWAAKDGSYYKMQAPGTYTKLLADYAKALAARLQEAGIEPVYECDNVEIFPGRQAQGDVEYLFAVNTANDAAVSFSEPVASEATISVKADGRPVYDAVLGHEATQFVNTDGKLTAKFRFGAGAMKIWARTSSAITGVQALPAVQFADFTVEKDPLRVELSAVVTGAENRVLAGAIPMQITLTDPLGVVRYDLYRATNRGMLKLTLPLAANDPTGLWKVLYRELLSGKETSGSFTFASAPSAGALAGAQPRAVYFGNDRENIFRFFKLHKDVTIVVGTSDIARPAADRLASILAPWGVRTKTVNAADVAGPRVISEEAQKTWAGLDAGKPDFKALTAGMTGFNVDGPVILIGTPEDNPLIAFASTRGFLPYKASVDLFPGRGRGYISWQTDAVGYFNQESIALIGYDEVGLAEAVGSVYECAAGIDPLVALEPGDVTVASLAKATPTPSGLATVWKAEVNDHVLGLSAAGGAITVISDDGSLTTVDESGKITGSKVVAFADAQAQAKAMSQAPDLKAASLVKAPGFVAKFTQASDAGTIIAYWGGMVKVVDADGNVKLQRLFQNDIGGMAMVGERLVVGLADGSVIAVDLK